MLLDATRTVREFAVEMPNATRVFEELKIDYCCGGDEPLNNACAKAGLPVEEVFSLLTQAGSISDESEVLHAQSQPLTRLANYIIEKHHVFTRNEVERVTALLEKVCSVHGANHPELLQIQSQFQTLRAELEPHMMKEERMLFPYIVGLEAAVADNQPAPFAPFGTVGNPIAMMMREHEAAGEMLREMRKLSADYRVPADVCISYQTLYRALEAFEQDLHQHIHLENNILFPRAIKLEATPA